LICDTGMHIARIRFYLLTSTEDDFPENGVLLALNISVSYDAGYIMQGTEETIIVTPGEEIASKWETWMSDKEAESFLPLRSDISLLAETRKNIELIRDENTQEEIEDEYEEILLPEACQLPLKVGSLYFLICSMTKWWVIQYFQTMGTIPTFENAEIVDVTMRYCQQ
jgi:hypothetical protein